MKQYLITEEQRSVILDILADWNIGRELINVKPIEPLSDRDLFEIIRNSANVEDRNMLPFSFAREIEAAHGIGEAQ